MLKKPPRPFTPEAFAVVAKVLRLPINLKMLGYTQTQNTYWYADLASDPVKAARRAMRRGRDGEELPLRPGR
jgi:hypothetical protein